MKKYISVFKISWQQALEYRLDFLIGRVRDMLFLLTVYFLWNTVFKGKKVLFGFEESQIITYVLGTTLISAFIFDYAMDKIAIGISQGDLSGFLVKPINYMTYHQVKRLAATLLQIILTFLELIIFLLWVRPGFFLQVESIFILLSLISLLLTLFLFMVIDSLAGILSFWTLYAYGPRFALKMFMDLTSGRIFPLSILPTVLFNLLTFLPFSYLVFFPLNVYLGKFTLRETFVGISTQILWILGLIVGLRLAWKRGLRIYEAVGI